jgi:hypothetical protein
MMPGGAKVSAETNARRQNNAVRAANASAGRQKVARSVAALPPAANPQAELLAAARAGDKHAQWRADELFVNWRRKAVA